MRILAFILLAATLTACGGGGDAVNAPGATPVPPPSPPIQVRECTEEEKRIDAEAGTRYCQPYEVQQ